MRELTADELDLISGGNWGSEDDPNEDIVVTGSPYPPPYYPPPPYNPFPPPPPPTYYPPPYYPPSGPAADGDVITMDTSEAGEIDPTELSALYNIQTATLNVQSMLRDLGGTAIPIPPEYGLPGITADQILPGALNIDFKIMLNDGIDNGGVGSTQGTFADPLFVLETNGPTGQNGLTAYGSSIQMGEAYVLHELAHSLPASAQFYANEFSAWRSANPGQPDSGFAGSANWVRNEAFAWSVARSIAEGSGRSWNHQPNEGYLW